MASVEKDEQNDTTAAPEKETSPEIETQDRRRKANPAGLLAGGVKKFGSMSRRRRVAAASLLAIALTGAAVGASSLTVSAQDPGASALAPGAPALPSPADGDMTMTVVSPNPDAAKVSVPQMLRTCDGSSCYYAPPAKVPTLTAPVGSEISLATGVSAAFTLSGYNVNAAAAPAVFTTTGKSVSSSGVPAGTYLLTLVGQPDGGWYQVTLILSPPAPAPAPAQSH